MYERALSERMPSALARATEHWKQQHPTEGADASGDATPRFTVAISREAGAQGTTLARAVGARLGWPVYDHELVEQIAQDMHVRVELLESVDEKRVSWLQECLEAFAALKTVTQSSYVHHLVETLLSLGAHGRCVIVGRGAAHVLPCETTLRVRVVAPLHERITHIGHQMGLSRDAAAAHLTATDHQRTAFVKDHFQVDPADPERYDLVVNSARFPIGECVQVITDGLQRLQERALRQAAVLGPSC